MTVKESILSLVPKQLELSARFNYNRVLGRLEPEIDIIEKIAGQRRRCIDIGANVGLYTYRFAQLFRYVESFEPIPLCAKIISSSKLRNVTVHNTALSNQHGQATLNIPATGGPEATSFASLSNQFAEADTLTVDLQTLDSFEFSEVDLIKIDVEGHELEVLQGGLETLKRESPTLLIEVEQRHHPASGIEEIFTFILALGYRGSFLQHGRMTDLSEFDLAKHQSCSDPRSLEYINNFIFQPARG
jgi:FkbM family methyltransferase